MYLLIHLIYSRIHENVAPVCFFSYIIITLVLNVIFVITNFIKNLFQCHRLLLHRPDSNNFLVFSFSDSATDVVNLNAALLFRYVSLISHVQFTHPCKVT